MKIQGELLKYLYDEAFKTSLTIDFERRKFRAVSREAAITEMIGNKRVIHIGCTDHKEIISEKIKNNTWLHKLITENAEKCAGIDIDAESVGYVREELGYDNVYQGNILTDDFPVINEEKWDYAVFGEIVEHLDDPVEFLKVFGTKYGGNTGRFIITVPNIYNKLQYRNMLNYREVINSDHRFWFTPYTILKVVARAGYRPEEMTFANLQRLNFAELAIRKIKKFSGMEISYPYYYFNSIIITGTIRAQ
ncbi:MAG: methyltransferase domain-containing protein [Bacteroidales bacterium]|jgi:hypothetical protein|nr:methyltransferase domain-containing protein [Bacteroidales bacterium]